ncbi:hypothetical protein GLOIN_2v1470997 [Rhizophagus clarus]|uniref:Uncharacterized protein n=1 Tax=Rhizophagus clarus TaxID=94130 RepID=A0A8H3LVJ1_9GLOM|nr:hypothetical protein GLOIN_2v1470997 [Rhizophagus clarus]
MNAKRDVELHTFTNKYEYKSDLILQICKEISKAIQNENNSAEIICSMLHGQIRNINKVENCINEEFRQLFRNNVLNHQKRNEWLTEKDININEDVYELKQNLLNNLEDYFPGFKYLFEYSWKSLDDNNNRHEGDFIFASDFGVFIVVEVKCFGKICWEIYYTYRCDIYAKSRRYHEFQASNNQITSPIRQEIDHSQSTYPSQQEEPPSISVTGAVVGIAAAAAIGYVICTKIPIKTFITTGTMIYKAYQGYQEFSKNYNNDNNNINNLD